MQQAEVKPVEIKEITKIEDYEGLVFNLETEDGEYIVNDIIVHNCPHYFMLSYAGNEDISCDELWMGQ